MWFKRKSSIFTLPALLLLGGVLIPASNTFAVNLKDTYFVISIADMCWLLCFLFLILALLYRLSEHFRLELRNDLFKIHAIVTIASSVGLFVTIWLMHRAESNFDVYNDGIPLDFYVIAYLMLLAASQLIFIINLIAGVFKKLRN